MPKRKIHEDIDILLLGKPFSNVNATLDWPAKVLGGSHRKALHTIPEGFIAGLILTGELNGAFAGVLHILVDAAESSGKKEIKKLIKNRRERNCRKKRKIARRKSIRDGST